MARAPVPQPIKAWALVTAAGVYVLASIGPSVGAVMGWIERNRRRGLACLSEGERIGPVQIGHDASRDDIAADALARQVHRNRL